MSELCTPPPHPHATTGLRQSPPPKIAGWKRREPAGLWGGSTCAAKHLLLYSFANCGGVAPPHTHTLCGQVTGRDNERCHRGRASWTSSRAFLTSQVKSMPKTPGPTEAAAGRRRLTPAGSQRPSFSLLFASQQRQSPEPRHNSILFYAEMIVRCFFLFFLSFWVSQSNKRPPASASTHLVGKQKMGS